MGGCCSSSSSQKFRLQGTPVYYYCPPASEEHSAFSTSRLLMIDVNNLDTSIPDTYKSPPRPIPFDVVLGIPQSANTLCPDHHSQANNCGDLISYHHQKLPHHHHVSVKELNCEPEDDTLYVESPNKQVDVVFQTSKGRLLELCTNMEEEDVCPTCFEEYDAENPRIATKCNHQFHLSCILEWMERSDTCPICNQEMVFKALS